MAFDRLLARMFDANLPGRDGWVLKGGYALEMRFHRARATKDLDLLVSPSGDNLDRVAQALERFGAAQNVIVAARNLREQEVVYLGVAPVRVDILRGADGIDDVDSILARSVVTSVGNLTVPIIALDDLIANKRAAGRPQDLADLVLLERVRRRK